MGEGGKYSPQCRIRGASQPDRRGSRKSVCFSIHHSGRVAAALMAWAQMWSVWKAGGV